MITPSVPINDFHALWKTQARVLLYSIVGENLTVTTYKPTVNISGAGLASMNQQEAQLMLTTGSTSLAVSRGQQTWYHSTCYI